MHGDPDVDRCNALVERGLSVRAVQIYSSMEEYKWDKTLVRKYPLVTIEESERQSLARRFITAVKVLFQVISSKSKVNIVYGYQVPAFFVATVLLKMVGRKTICIYDSKFDDYLRYILKDLIKWCMLSPYEGFLAASSRTADYLRFFGKRNIETYYCAINVRKMIEETLSAPHTVDFLDRYFICVARFVPKKNHQTLLRAYEMYALEVSSPRRLLLVGYGPLESQLRTQISKSTVLSRLVEIKGYSNKKQVFALMKNAVALVLPSIEEQFGIVVTEALANGIPVIISDRCGAADLVQSGINGFRVEPMNATGLAYYLKAISADHVFWRQLCAASPSSVEKADVSSFCGSVFKLSSTLLRAGKVAA